MSVLEIAVELRNGIGKGAARTARAAGKVPGIIYGDKGSSGTPITMDANKLRFTLLKHPTMLKLIGGLDKTCVVRDLQRHPVTGALVHIDLEIVEAGKLIRLSLPIHIKGTAEGVKNGGVLEQIKHHIEIEANPLDAPDKIEIDITNLKLNEKLHASSIALPAGVRLIDDPDDTVVVIHAAKHQEEKPATETVAAPEVITERKKEE